MLERVRTAWTQWHAVRNAESILKESSKPFNKYYDVAVPFACYGNIGNFLRRGSPTLEVISTPSARVQQHGEDMLAVLQRKFQNTPPPRDIYPPRSLVVSLNEREIVLIGSALLREVQNLRQVYRTAKIPSDYSTAFRRNDFLTLKEGLVKAGWKGKSNELAFIENCFVTLR